MGQILDLPIIIRSLADSMAMLNEDDLPIKFHPEFLLTLDTGDQHSIASPVTKYERTWWNRRKPKSISSVPILDSSCIKEALKDYNDKLASIPSEKVTEKEPIPATTLTTFNLDSDTLAGISTGTGVECQKCVDYKNILCDTLHDFVDMHKYFNIVTTSSRNQWYLDMRRASIFNELHDAAVLKETATTETSVPTTSFPVSPTPASITSTAREELHRLRNLPISSYKWTWGINLTEADVLDMRRRGRNQPKTTQSGYDLSLTDDRPVVDDSTHFDPSAPDIFDNLSAEVTRPAPLLKSDKKIFAKRSGGQYDPLSARLDTDDETGEDIPPVDFPAHLTIAEKWAPATDQGDSEGQATKHIAEKWIPEPHDEEAPFTIADEWSPASDDEKTPDFLSIADRWLPASDDEREPHHNDDEVPAIFAIAENWEANTPADESTTSSVGQFVDFAESWECAEDVVPVCDEEVSRSISASFIPSRAGPGPQTEEMAAANQQLHNLEELERDYTRRKFGDINLYIPVGNAPVLQPVMTTCMIILKVGNKLNLKC